MSERPSVGFRYALRGLAVAWRSQLNFRIQVGAAALAIALAIVLGARLVPIVLVAGLVLALELVNTALEALVDLVSPEHRALAARAKDTAAAAVLVAAVAAVVVGLVELGPPLWAWLGGGP